MTRKIIHIDMDAFYAAVEQRDNPSLAGKPIVVGGSPEGRGVVSTASYEARVFGVRSAMATKTALRLCPHLIVVPPRFDAYKAVSTALYGFYREYTDLVEPLSLDECYLDVTENKQGIATATEIAQRLKARIKKELNLTASAGVAPNKLLAKIGSDWKKPDGLFVIKPSMVDAFMETLPLSRVWGVGQRTQEKLASLGLTTAGDVKRYPKEKLLQACGKMGETIFAFAHGIDDRPVITEREAKSIGSERTFAHDIIDKRMVLTLLRDEVATVTDRLAKARALAKTLTLKVKYADFTRHTHRHTLAEATREPSVVFFVIKRLVDETEIGTRPVRLVGATASNLLFEGKADIARTGDLFPFDYAD